MNVILLLTIVLLLYMNSVLTGCWWGYRWGILSRNILFWGILAERFCLGGFCPRGILAVISAGEGFYPSGISALVYCLGGFCPRGIMS